MLTSGVDLTSQESRTQERARLAGPPPAHLWLRYCPYPAVREDPVLAKLGRCLAEPETIERLEALERREEYPRPVLDDLRRLGLCELFSAIGPEPRATAFHLSALNVLTAGRDTSLAVTVGVNSLSLISAYVAASPQQLEEILGRVADGAFSSMLLTELECGSDLIRSRARAEPGTLTEDGRFLELGPAQTATHYRIRGEKQLINGGREHEQFFVLLRTRAHEESDGDSPFAGRGAHSLFWIERQEGTVGLPRWPTLPAQGADISGVRFDDLVVDAGHRLGPEGEGFSLVQKTLSISRGGIAALAVGTLELAHNLATTYAAKRCLYGKPITAQVAITDHLIKMGALLRAASAGSLRACAWANASGLKAAPYTGVAKLMSCRLAEEGIDEGRRVLGGRALLRELPYARLIRDVLLFGVFDGTTHVMLEELKARLAMAVRKWSSGSGQDRDTLAEARRVYTAPLRSLVDAVREPPQVRRPLPTVQHAKNLAALEGAIPLEPLADLSTALFAVTARLMERGDWGEDQGLRHELATTYALVEILVGMVELFDPDRRLAVIGVPAEETPLDVLETRFALGWLGSRACAQLSQRMARAGLGAEVLGADRGGLGAIEAGFLRGHDELRRDLSAALRERTG